MTTRRPQRLALGAGILAMTIALVGCSPETGLTDPTGDAPQHPDSGEQAPEEGPDQPQSPAQQAASCEWDKPPVSGGAPVAPDGTAGELATVLIGSWQHTHYDTGGGFQTVGADDIRYVFPADEQMIYCQHVEGITNHAEHKTKYTLDGSTVKPPSPHSGFEAVAWSNDVMVWKNNLDGSTYLLVRR